MLFHVRTPRVSKSEKPRFDAFANLAIDKCEAFLALNPCRRASVFIRVKRWNRRLIAHCCYSSTQGTSVFDVVISD